MTSVSSGFITLMLIFSGVSGPQLQLSLSGCENWSIWSHQLFHWSVWRLRKVILLTIIGEAVDKLELSCLAIEKVKWYRHCERVWWFLKKLNIELQYDPIIPLLGMHPKEFKSGTHANICTPTFIAALLTLAKSWKQPKCLLTEEWINKMLFIHTIECYSALKTKEILTHVTTWMNFEDLGLSEVSQSQKDKYCMIPLIRGT